MSPLFNAADLSEITIGFLFRTQFACKGTTFFLIMQINCYFFAYGKSKGAKVCLMDLLTTRLGR